MGQRQEDLVNRFGGYLIGLTPEIHQTHPVICSWIPLDVGGLNSGIREHFGGTKDLPEPTVEDFNDFNLKVDDLVGSYDVPWHDTQTGVVFPGGRPLDYNLQNMIANYYRANSIRFPEEVQYLRPVNHSFKSVFSERQKTSGWFYTHRGLAGGRGASINRVSIFGSNWPIDETLDDPSNPHVLHPNADSLLPFIFGVSNYPTLGVTLDDHVDIDSYEPPSIPSKIFFAINGTRKNTMTTLTSIKPPHIESSMSSYKRVSPRELEKKAFAPINLVYIKYTDPILKYLMHPSASLNWSKLQYTLKTLGVTWLTHNIPRILVFIPTDNITHTLLNGSGSKQVRTNSRSMSFCRELEPKGWYTHAFEHPDIISL